MKLLADIKLADSMSIVANSINKFRVAIAVVVVVVIDVDESHQGE